MDTVCAGRTRDVETIVDEQARPGAAGNGGRPRCEFEKNARRQRFLTYLNDGDARGYDCFDEPQDV